MTASGFSLSGLIDRFDDWINPIVVKELRQAVKSRMVVAILMLFLGVQLFLLFMFILFGQFSSEDSIDWSAGTKVFAFQQGILLFTLMMLVPAYATIRLGAERSGNNVDLLFISTLRPRSIIAGKFIAALVLALLVYSTCAPFMTFTYLLRGIDIPTILTILAIDLLLTLLATMIALFLAALPGTLAFKIVVVFFGFIFIIFIGTIYSIVGTVMLVSGERLFFWEEMLGNWVIPTLAVAHILGVVGLFFLYSVALISPPSSNRILPIRIYVVAVWLVMSAAMFLTSYYYSWPRVEPVPLFFVLVLTTLLLSTPVLISICERERWGPRVARTIPRRLWLRPLAFLFYTGSAGGVTLTTLMLAATYLGVWWWHDHFATTAPRALGPDFWNALETFLIVTVAISLYTFCYGLTAILIRTHLLANQLKPAFTWLVVLLLVGVGSSVPSLLAYIFFSEDMRLGTDSGWWMLTNPFMAISEISGSTFSSRNHEDFRTLCFWFLGIWAFLVAGLSLPWYIAQVQFFRPPVRREPAPDPIPLVEMRPAPSVEAE